MSALCLKIKSSKLWPVLRIDEILDAVHPACWIDMRNAFPHGMYFGLPQSGIERMNLAVDVGLCNMVKVNQCQMGHTAARQCFSGPGANTAETDDDDV